MTEKPTPVRCGCGGELHIYPKNIYNYDLGLETFVFYGMCNKCWINTLCYNTEDEVVEVWNRAMGNVQKMHDPLVHCKDCKHYAEDVFAYADHTPIIVAHGACKVWGGPLGSKTDPEGWCYLGVRKEDNDGDTDAKA